MEEKRVITFSQIKESLLLKIEMYIRAYSDDNVTCYEELNNLRTRLIGLYQFDVIDLDELGELNKIVSSVICTYVLDHRWMEYHEYADL